MAKRFTDSDKWRDPWFSELKGDKQLFFLFVLDTCDCAGIWKEQLKYFEFLTGIKITAKDIETHFSSKIIGIGERIYFVPKFIYFQYGELRPDKNAAHRGVVKSLVYNGVTEISEVGNTIRLPEGMSLEQALTKPLRSPTGLGLGKGEGEGTGIGLGKGLTTTEIPF
jgi:hypothetical protein